MNLFSVLTTYFAKNVAFVSKKGNCFHKGFTFTGMARNQPLGLAPALFRIHRKKKSSVSKNNF